MKSCCLFFVDLDIEKIKLLNLLWRISILSEIKLVPKCLVIMYVVIVRSVLRNKN